MCGLASPSGDKGKSLHMRPTHIPGRHAPRASGAKSSGRADTLGWPVLDLGPSQKSPVPVLPNQGRWEEQEQKQERLQSLRKVFRCEGDTCTLRQACTGWATSSTEAQTCRGEKAQAQGPALPGSHWDKEPLALHYYTMPATISLVLKAKTLRLGKNMKPDRFNSVGPLNIKFL